MIDEYPEERAVALIAAHPEFANAGSLAVAAIKFALPQIDANVWGDKAGIGVDLLACDWLACSPYGQSMRTDDDKDKPSRYRTQYEQVRALVAPRGFVI